MVLPGVKSRAAGYFYMGEKIVWKTPQSKLDEPIHIECILLKRVMKLVAEAETGAAFRNCKTAKRCSKP